MERENNSFRSIRSISRTKSLLPFVVAFVTLNCATQVKNVVERPSSTSATSPVDEKTELYRTAEYLLGETRQLEERAEALFRIDTGLVDYPALSKISRKMNGDILRFRQDPKNFRSQLEESYIKFTVMIQPFRRRLENLKRASDLYQEILEYYTVLFLYAVERSFIVTEVYEKRMIFCRNRMSTIVLELKNLERNLTKAGFEKVPSAEDVFLYPTLPDLKQIIPKSPKKNHDDT